MDIKEQRKKLLTDTKVERWDHPDKLAHLWGVVQGVAEIVDGLVTLLSLGFFVSNFDMQVAFYRSFSHHLRQKKKKALSQTNTE